MAIASIDPDALGPPAIILVVIRAITEDLINIEKTMRQHGLVILQKKILETSLEEMKSWFSEELAQGENLITTGYVIQSQNVHNIWKEVTQEYGENVCGIATLDDLRQNFPSVVVDDYLLQPTTAADYLDQMKPILLAGLQDICDAKPEDPVYHLALFLKNACSS